MCIQSVNELGKQNSVVVNIIGDDCRLQSSVDIS